MDTSDWIAVAAVVVAVVAAGISAYAIRYARQSAVHAGASVVEARRSADEAAKMRELDEDRRREERERRHEELAPDLPGEIDASFRPNQRLGGGHGSLFGTIKLPRGYRVKAEAIATAGSRTELSLGMLVPPDREVEFQIEPRHPDQQELRMEEILFRFWPPVEGVDEVPSWSCECGRPTGGTLEGAGHWERRVKVTFRRPRLTRL
jgi:hypothetical protein